jgi:hypothetical protein
MLMLKSYVPLYYHGEIQIQTLTHGYQDCLVPDVFQNVISKLVQDMEYVKTYLDDLLILTNSSFKEHLLKLEMVLARLSTVGMRVNISKSKFFAEQIEYLGYWITRQVFNLYVTRLISMIFLIISRRPKQEKKNQLRQFIGIVNYDRDM